MRHLKPVTKAQLSWFNQTPLQIIIRLVQLIATIVPIITTLMESKQPEETTS